MKKIKLTAIVAFIAGTIPLTGIGQVVVLGSPAAEADTSGQATVNLVPGTANTQPVLAPAVPQPQRGIGIGSQVSAPTIAPQFNEPMIGQQGSTSIPTGLPQTGQLLPPGVQPGLSDQGVILPAAGTIVASPQATTTFFVSPQGTVFALQSSGNASTISVQAQGTTISPTTVTITPNSVSSPAVSARTSNGTTLTPTGRSTTSATASGARGAAAAGSGGGR